MRTNLNCVAGSSPHCQNDHKCEALSLMLQALEQLDSDPAIPAIIGAQLQYAIDIFCAEFSIELPEPNIH